MFKRKNMLATTSITTLSCTLSSNFIYMSTGTLYMVSVRHSATCQSGIYLLRQCRFGIDRADVVSSVISQGPSIWFNDSIDTIFLCFINIIYSSMYFGTR